MDSIKFALNKFSEMTNYKYLFQIAYKKQIYELTLSFDLKDFSHMAGLHYLKDIDIPKNASKLCPKIEDGSINDEYLRKSKKYNASSDNVKDIESRIFNIRYIEQFLDSRNLVFNYLSSLNRRSVIEADYLIKSTYNNVTAYIFIRKRRENSEYCICSFFVDPPMSYIGEKAYWWYKAKRHMPTNSLTVFIDKTEQTKVADKTNEAEKQVAVTSEVIKEAESDKEEVR